MKRSTSQRVACAKLVTRAASLKKMTTPFKGGYAFGLLINTNGGRTAITHNGGIEGFNSAMAYYPDTAVTVIVLGNVNGTAPDELADKIGRVAHGEKILAPGERTAIALPRATLTSYVGVYQFAPTFSIAITLDGDQLFEQATNQPRIPIFPESETKFFLRVVDAQLEFHSDASGAVTGVVLHQAGRDVTGRRQ